MVQQGEATRATPKKGLHPFFHLAIALVVIGLLQGFVIKPFVIPSASMEPTLVVGDRILVNRTAYVGSAPGPGDVVVFRADESWGVPPTDGDSVVKYAVKWLGSLIGVGPGVDHIMAKRIIATGGQTIECCDAAGNVLVDGVAIDAPPDNDFPFEQGTLDCMTSPASQRCFPPLIVPEGTLVVAGDNRANSRDSLTQCRQAGATELCLLTVDETDVIGEVVFRWAPLDEFGPL